ncbi:MAG: tRNA lysidine(34) synthetase TilS [Desulfobulbaceae bacterium]|nr:tRNA lysidine(34) synthetase TilS [Desulfobulbaceae bacterium]
MLGVSGGADSTGLLAVLARLREHLNVSLIAVYIDHGLRPSETVNEKSCVQSLAADLQADFTSIGVNTTEHARAMKLSLEHSARELRYQALRKVAGERHASCIATAHTADDQAEEILIRLLRGSGRQGLSGMRTKSGDIVRPFLETKKKDIIAYLADRNVRYLEDSSNADPRFLRNRVRLELIPLLERNFDAGIKQALRKTARNLAEDEKLLDELTETAYERVLIPAGAEDQTAFLKFRLDRQEFLKQPGALQRRIIEKILWRIGSIAHFSHILQIVEAARTGRTGTEYHLSRGLRVGVQKHYLEFVYPEGRRPWRGRLYRE